MGLEGTYGGDSRWSHSQQSSSEPLTASRHGTNRAKMCSASPSSSQGGSFLSHQHISVCLSPYSHSGQIISLASLALVSCHTHSACLAWPGLSAAFRESAASGSAKHEIHICHKAQESPGVTARAQPLGTPGSRSPLGTTENPKIQTSQPHIY